MTSNDDKKRNNGNGMKDIKDEDADLQDSTDLQEDLSRDE